MRIDCIKIALAGLLLAGSTPLVQAQAPSAIGVINIQSAILATQDGNKAREEIRTRFEPRAKQMEARMGEINSRRDTLSKGANTMSQEQQDKLRREIEDMQKKYQWDAEDLQQELGQAEQQFVGEIGNRMIQIIDEYAKARGLAVVIDVGGQQSPVLWAAAGTDITQAIVEAYDRKFGSGASAAAPAKPAPATPVAKPAPATPAAKPAAPPK